MLLYYVSNYKEGAVAEWSKIDKINENQKIRQPWQTKKVLYLEIASLSKIASLY